MNYLIPLILMLFTSTLWAQSVFEENLLKEEEEQLSRLKRQKEMTQSYEKSFESTLKQVNELKEKDSDLEVYVEHFEENKTNTQEEISEIISNFSVFKKFGARGALYKCFQEELGKKGFLNPKLCTSKHHPKLKKEEKEQIERWGKNLGMDLTEAQKKSERNKEELKRWEERLVSGQKSVESSRNYEEILNKNLSMIEIKKSELDLIPKFQNMINCKAGSPEIDLEKETPFTGADFKGPFFEVPRDNQDGLGTCYANAAKNLLVGISEGKDIASFLDMALSYKKSNGAIKNDGLDAGNSCQTLEAVSKYGYCPQQYAPLETGERNVVGEGLFNLGEYNYLATNVNMLRDFIQGLNDFQKNKSPVSEDILLRSRDIIESLKTEGALIYPMPVVRHHVPTEWKIGEAYHRHNIKAKNISIEAFKDEHEDAYKKFFPEYIKAVMAGKNADEIFELYKKIMNPFITKYGIEGSLPEFERVYKINSKSDFEDNELKTKLSQSLDFLKKVMNKKDLKDEEFLAFCGTDGAESLRFISQLEPLISKLKDQKLNLDAMFDENGKFKDADDLMQLTVAPSCLNKSNRKQIPAFTCDQGYKTVSDIKNSGKPLEEKKKMMRERVIISLVKGYPLGNSFPTSSGGGHINTIVGMRFNSQTNSCEYRIRESQTGTTGWTREDDIFNKISALVEVRRN